MSQFRIAVETLATPSQVWSVISDIERWPEWTASITSIERLDRGPITKGSRARIRQPKLLPAVWLITEWNEAQTTFTWVTRAPGIQVTARHDIRAIAGGSRIELLLEFAGLLGPLAGRLTSGINQRYIAMEANGLAARALTLGRAAS